MTALELLRGDHSEVWNELRRYTPQTAARLIEDAGLQVARITYLFASLVPLMLAVRRGQRILRRFREPRGDEDLAVPPGPINATLTALVTGEAALARHVSMPFGSSLLVVGRKP